MFLDSGSIWIHLAYDILAFDDEEVCDEDLRRA